MLLRYKLIIGFLFIFIYGNCQYDPMSSLSMYNTMFYNPGYAGDGNEIEARVLVRNQYLNIEGAPKTVVANVDAPFKLFNRNHGVGLSIVSDQLGFQQDVGINLSYAYRKSLVQGEIGFGIGLNMVNYGMIDADWLIGDTEATGDNNIPDNASNQPLTFGANLGVFYRSDNVYFSASIRNATGSTVEWISETASNSDYQIKQTFYLSTGYDYQLPNPLYSFQPNVYLCSDFSVTQVNLVGKLTYNNKFFGGLGYRPWDALWVIGGFDLPSGFNVAVSYDIQTSRMSKASAGSFEFMLGYSFNLEVDKDSKKYKSVRLL